MRVISLLMILGAALLGISEGDCTAAVIIVFLAIPQLMKKTPSARNGNAPRAKGK